MNEKIKQLDEAFSILPDWEEKYAYIIDLGKKLPVLPENYKTEDYRVRGCVSQVWMVPQYDADKDIVLFTGDSDAIIVKGLVALLVMIYSGHSPREIGEVPIEKLFESWGLSQHLTPSRRNGLFSMVNKIKNLAHHADA